LATVIKSPFHEILSTGFTLTAVFFYSLEFVFV